ncbi:MAG: hypothetical protein IT349_01010 [Candidatus Eisenbacteria bacterium]|nr:hypothetical protein [Candidatus Eisenbacteria bacterium]MCC7140656.1 hypothetical protein [Candidatus Eisenbacteria bacterium]
MQARGERPPVAVVALGDTSHHDEALPARVMGRSRTLIGEIGRLRSRPATLSFADQPETDGSLALAAAPAPTAGRLVEWVECGGASARLDRVLEGRRRVVLIDTVSFGEKPGTVCHWHLGRGGDRGKITALRHYHKTRTMGLDHLAFWLEDDLPPGGLDFIGIEPHDLSEGEGISTPLRKKLVTISSQVTAVLLRVLAEEGW